MFETFEQNFTVELSDINPTFGLKPTAVLKYYQEAFARYCAEHNVAAYNLFKIGLKWVFGQTIIEYFDTIPIWNEEINAKVYITCVKKLRIYIDFEVKTKRGLVAKGQTVAYTIDLETSRPMPIEEIAEKFEIGEENKSGEIIKIDLGEYGELISSQEHTITFSDIDFNNHTNNISYLSLGFEGMSQDFIKQYRPKMLDIRYLQETFLNDTLRCDIFENGNNYGFKIINTKDNSEVCLIKSTWQANEISPKKFFEILDEVKELCIIG